MRNLLLVAFVALALFSCSKNGSDATEITQAHIAGTWRVSGMTTDRAMDWDQNGTNETNLYATWNSCERDNLIIFNSNGTGSTRPSCSAPTSSLYWTLSGNQLNYTIAGTSGTSLTVTSLSNNTMTTQNTLYYGGQSAIITTTFTRQ